MEIGEIRMGNWRCTIRLESTYVFASKRKWLHKRDKCSDIGRKAKWGLETVRRGKFNQNEVANMSRLGFAPTESLVLWEIGFLLVGDGAGRRGTGIGCLPLSRRSGRHPLCASTASHIRCPGSLKDG